MKPLKTFALATSLCFSLGLVVSGCGKKQEGAAKGKAEDKPRAAKVEAPPPPPPNFPGASPALEAISRYVPAKAQSILAVDVKSVLGSPLWPKIEAGANSSAEARKLRKVLTDCGSKVTDLDALLAAADDAESAVILLRGAGMGGDEKVRCLSKGMAGVRGAAPPTLKKVERKGVTTLEPEKNPQLIAVLVDGETVALTSPSWVDQVAARVSGTPERFEKTKLGKLSKHVAFDRPLWFVGEFPKRAEQLVQGTPLDAATDLTGFVDIRKGLDLRVDIGLENRAQAAAAMDNMRDFYTQQRPLLAMLSGLKDTTLNKLKIASKEDRASVALQLTFEEVDQIQKSVQRMMGGGTPGAVANHPAQAPAGDAGGAPGAAKKPGAAPAAKKKG